MPRTADIFRASISVTASKLARSAGLGACRHEPPRLEVFKVLAQAKVREQVQARETWGQKRNSAP